MSIPWKDPLGPLRLLSPGRAIAPLAAATGRAAYIISGAFSIDSLKDEPSDGGDGDENVGEKVGHGSGGMIPLRAA
jgi:hypothetical protein